VATPCFPAAIAAVVIQEYRVRGERWIAALITRCFRARKMSFDLRRHDPPGGIQALAREREPARRFEPAHEHVAERARRREHAAGAPEWRERVLLQRERERALGDLDCGVRQSTADVERERRNGLEVRK
jgi:hypothetical protein